MEYAADAPQGGRKLAQVFDQSRCALDFSRCGVSSMCKPAGQEPDRQQDPKASDYKMLIPVFRKEAEGAATVYEGGFVRVTPGQVIAAADPAKLAVAGTAKKLSGYDLVLAIDATASMSAYFKATLDAVNDFVNQITSDLSQGKIKESLRIGLLFYQDRKIGTECTLDYLTQWRVMLSAQAGNETIGAVRTALAKEHEATCGSDEPEEPVFDGVMRALQDTDWKDGYFRVVALIGDADPHADPNAPGYEKKNPMHLSVQTLQQKADEKNVRFVATRIFDGASNAAATPFETLALQRSQQALVGRFNRIPGDPAQMRQALASSLLTDWRSIIKTARTLETSNATKENANHCSRAIRKDQISCKPGRQQVMTPPDPAPAALPACAPCS